MNHDKYEPESFITLELEHLNISLYQIDPPNL
jgi:hypothetical protein